MVGPSSSLGLVVLHCWMVQLQKCLAAAVGGFCTAPSPCLHRGVGLKANLRIPCAIFSRTQRGGHNAIRREILSMLHDEISLSMLLAEHCRPKILLRKAAMNMCNTNRAQRLDHAFESADKHAIPQVLQEFASGACANRSH